MSANSLVLVASVLTLGLNFLPNYAEADTEQRCVLSQVASVDLGVSSDGSPTIPVTISGHSSNFLVSPSSSGSWISARLADSLGLSAQKMENGTYDIIDGKKTSSLAILHDVNIGTLHGERFIFVKAAPDIASDADGEIGLDILAQFDLDLDMRANKLNLFSQDHCPGKVVYWADKYGVVPFGVDDVGHPYFSARLDDKDVDVSLGVGSKTSLMGMATASDLLGIAANDARLVPYPPPAGDDGPHYTYPFMKLSLGDLTVCHPSIVLFPQKESERCGSHGPTSRCYGTSDLFLGRAELNRLHLFFAFKEKMLYLTTTDRSGSTCSESNSSFAPSPTK